MAKAISYAQWSLEPYCLGMKLRALRTQKRLTLARLAAETDLSTALLSKLETDRMVPTLSTLATISRVYGVGMSYFFQEPSRHSFAITRKAHFAGQERGADQPRVTALNAVGEVAPLGSRRGRESALQADMSKPGVLSPGLLAQMIDFPAGGAATPPSSVWKSSGVVYVLEGRLQLDVGGLKEILEEGDCACVESDMALAWSAVGKQRCRVLAVSPSGQ